MKKISVSDPQINRLISEVSQKFTSAHFFKNGVIRGEEIPGFSSNKQVNKYILFQTYQDWNGHLSKMPHPWFDFEHTEVKNALLDFSNLLSRHVRIPKEDFGPMVEKAVYNSLKLILNPEEAFHNFFFMSQDSIPLTLFKRHAHYFVDFDFIIQSILKYHESKGISMVERSVFFEKLQKVVEIFEKRENRDIHQYQEFLFRRLTGHEIQTLQKESPESGPLKTTSPRVESPKPDFIARPETPKADPPKQEAPIVVPPVSQPLKAETPKADPPKQEAPKTEAPIVVPPVSQPLKAETPKADPPKQEAPKTEAPIVVPPVSQPLKAETPKADPPKQEAPKIEAPIVVPPVSQPIRIESLKTEIPQPPVTTPGELGKPPEKPRTLAEKMEQNRGGSPSVLDRLAPTHPEEKSVVEKMQEEKKASPSDSNRITGTPPFVPSPETPRSETSSPKIVPDTPSPEEVRVTPLVRKSNDDFQTKEIQREPVSSIPSPKKVETEVEEILPEIPMEVVPQNIPIRSEVIPSEMEPLAGEKEESPSTESPQSEGGRPIDLFSSGVQTMEEKYSQQRSSSDSPSLADKLKEESSGESLADKMAAQNVIKLEQIPVHKQFQFVQKVFGGSTVKFKVVLDKINKTQTMEEAEDVLNKYVFNSPESNPQDKVSQEFLLMVKNRFA